MKRYEEILEMLSKGAVKKSIVVNMLRGLLDAYDLDDEVLFDCTISCGAPLYTVMQDGIEYIDLSTKHLNMNDAKFCFVDIEVTNSKVEVGELMEIGAVITRADKILGKFRTFCNCKDIPENIAQLTGINNEMLKFAPKTGVVLENFRRFCKDSIFVAHNVSFDYNFLFHTYIKHGMLPLLNPFICTVQLASKFIDSPRYKLSFLNEYLNIGKCNMHRALPDAIVCKEVFKACLDKADPRPQTVHDLIMMLR